MPGVTGAPVTWRWLVVLLRRLAAGRGACRARMYDGPVDICASGRRASVDGPRDADGPWAPNRGTVGLRPTAPATPRSALPANISARHLEKSAPHVWGTRVRHWRPCILGCCPLHFGLPAPAFLGNAPRCSSRRSSCARLRKGWRIRSEGRAYLFGRAGASNRKAGASPEIVERQCRHRVKKTLDPPEKLTGPVAAVNRSTILVAGRPN